MADESTSETSLCVVPNEPRPPPSPIASSKLHLTSLPTSQLVEILEFLSLSDGRQCLMTCRNLWRQCQEVESKRGLARVQSWMDFHALIAMIPNLYRNYHLMELTLGRYATDELFMKLFVSTNPEEAHDNVPSLQRISCVGSDQLTDVGLLFIAPRHEGHEGEELSSRNQTTNPASMWPPQQQNLQYIDITFCPNTTYKATLELRRRLRRRRQDQQQQHAPQQPTLVIRRQPEWMDGCFETPFANDGLHTYWADGSFSYERQAQSQGYIQRIHSWKRRSGILTDHFSDSNVGNQHGYIQKEQDIHHVRTKLQFSNFEAPAHWPPWTKYIYRPGVSLLYLPEQQQDNDSNEGGRSILVSQMVRGLYPPPDWPKPCHQSLPIGVTRYFDRLGQMLPDDENNNDNNDNTEPDVIRRWFMVTRMRVRPLLTLMPPDELVQSIGEFFNAAADGILTDDRANRSLEHFLHLQLGGDPDLII
jgi:hypothetical protein